MNPWHPLVDTLYALTTMQIEFGKLRDDFEREVFWVAFPPFDELEVVG